MSRILPLWALLLLSWALAVTTKPQNEEVEVAVPGTSFTCHGRVGGYYADIESGCRLYHLCDGVGRQFTHACPNLTLFQQRMMVCDHWYMVNCSAAIVDYTANLLLGQRNQPFLGPEDHVQHQPRHYRQRVPLPVAFPYSRQSEDDSSAITQKSKSIVPTGEKNSASTSTGNKRKSVNDGGTISFSITSLPRAEQSDNQNYEYTNTRRLPERSKAKYNRQKIETEIPVVNQRINKYDSTTPPGLPIAAPVHETFSISSLPIARLSESNSHRQGAAHQRNTNYETTTAKVFTAPRPLYETFSISSLPSTRIQEQVSKQTDRDFNRPTYSRDNIETSTPKVFSSAVQTNSGFEIQTDKSVYIRPYESENNTPSPIESSTNVPRAYKNNPFLQSYFKSSTLAGSPVTTTLAPPVLSIDGEEDEGLGNRIEIILQDPRRMFFIPDSDLDLALGTENSTVLVIPIPTDHPHSYMRFRSDEKLMEGRNPQCPRCHPAFLAPGQCQPCVLIR